MTLKELKQQVYFAYENSSRDIEVCIPNGKPSYGGTSVTKVKSAYKGIDWDGGKFIIYPEKIMIEKQMK